MRKLGPLALSLLAACASTPGPETASEPLPTEQAATASLWNQHPSSLFGNRRARAVGDILTLIVEIDEEAEIGNQVQAGRTSERTMGVAGLFGLPQLAEGKLPGGAGLGDALDVTSGDQRTGGGTLRRQDRMTLRLAARVTERLPNGDLVVEGRQSVRVNREERVLHAAGIVRPEDISRANTVTHDKMAEAEIGYLGRGAIDRSMRPRLGDRILDAVLPF
jgi:flagellar L-ring protein precursor FlgH